MESGELQRVGVFQRLPLLVTNFLAGTLVLLFALGKSFFNFQFRVFIVCGISYQLLGLPCMCLSVSNKVVVWNLIL